MKLRVPHTFVLLFALVVLAAIATHFLPAGEYQRTEVAGRRVVDPDSYRAIPAHPAGVRDVFLAWPRGLGATAAIVFAYFQGFHYAQGEVKTTNPIAILDVYNPPADFATPRGLPLTYLIAPDGKVAKQFLGPVTGREIEAAIAASGGPKAGA